MKAHRQLPGTMLMVSLMGLAGAARAQGEPEPPPAAPRPAATVKDGVRLRGGLSLNGGVFLLPANPTGGAFSLAGRLGVQFNHYFSIYYQNTPILGATLGQDKRSGTLAFADYNSLLLNLTLFHMFELGAGPSLDYVALAHGSLTIDGFNSSASASTGTGWAAGGHGRFAFIVGGLSGDGPRRSGLVLSVDAHPMFLSIGPTLSLTAGVGVEWY